MIKLKALQSLPYSFKHQKKLRALITKALLPNQSLLMENKEKIKINIVIKMELKRKFNSK